MQPASPRYARHGVACAARQAAARVQQCVRRTRGTTTLVRLAVWYDTVGARIGACRVRAGGRVLLSRTCRDESGEKSGGDRGGGRGSAVMAEGEMPLRAVVEVNRSARWPSRRQARPVSSRTNGGACAQASCGMARAVARAQRVAGACAAQKARGSGKRAAARTAASAQRGAVLPCWQDVRVAARRPANGSA